MIVIRCTDSLSGVGRGYTCLVGIRYIRHIRTTKQLNDLTAVGISARSVNASTFYEVLNGFGIPRAAVVNNADTLRV